MCSNFTHWRSNESFVYWLHKLSDVSNFHGMQWHRFVNKLPMKIFWVAFIFFIIFSIPTILIYKSVKFFSQNQIRTSVELGQVDKMKYPNVTVCFANYFDIGLLQGINKCVICCLWSAFSVKRLLPISASAA